MWLLAISLMASTCRGPAPERAAAGPLPHLLNPGIRPIHRGKRTGICSTWAAIEEHGLGSSMIGSDARPSREIERSRNCGRSGEERPMTNRSLMIAMMMALGVPATLSYAASGTLYLGGEEGGPVIYVGTNTVGGDCEVGHTWGVGSPPVLVSTTLTCYDAETGSLAVADTVVGCVQTAGSGICAIDPGPPIYPNAGSTLSCPDGKNYIVKTGTSDGSCNATGEGQNRRMNCEALSNNSSSADCNNGCGASHGAATCCVQGPGCSMWAARSL